MSKNALQEYYQKKKEPQPIYDTKRIGGTDHEPDWITILTLPTEKKTFQGTKKSTKSESQQEVADMAINFLHKRSQEPSKTLNFIENKDIGIFIDGDNLPTVFDSLAELKLPKNIHIHLFVNQGHNLATKEIPKRIQRVIVPVGHRDVADTIMTLHMGAYLFDKTYDKYIIVSKDHFAVVIVDAINAKTKDNKNVYLWDPSVAVLCMTIKDIEIQLS